MFDFKGEMKNKYILRFIMMIIVFTVLVSLNTYTASAAAGTVNESESNNTASTADRTYDDYDSRGKISTTDDVDWWVVSFSSNGMANFYLGNIPTNCDYDMYVYKNNGTTLVCSSATTNTHELLRCHVYANQNYRVKIVTSSNASTSYYTFRTKKYTMKDARMFTVNISNDINTRPSAQNSYSYIWKMGFSGTEYTNNSVVSACNVFSNSDIFVTNTHGAAGVVFFDTSDTNRTTLYADYLTYDNRSIADYFANSALSEVDLVIYSGCNTGATSSTYGNLVSATMAAGAYCCIGWKETIITGCSNNWLPEFFRVAATGVPLDAAMLAADEVIRVKYPGFLSNVKNRYYCGSPYNRLVLGDPS